MGELKVDQQFTMTTKRRNTLCHTCLCVVLFGYVYSVSPRNPLDASTIIDLDHNYLTYDSYHHNNYDINTIQYHFRSQKDESYRPLYHNPLIDLNVPLCYKEKGEIVCELGTETNTKFYHDPDRSVAVAITYENGTLKMQGVAHSENSTYEYTPLESSDMPNNRYHKIKKRWAANVIQQRVKQNKRVRPTKYKKQESPKKQKIQRRPYRKQIPKQQIYKTNNFKQAFKKIPTPKGTDELCVDILVVVDYSIYKKFQKAERKTGKCMEKLRYYYAHVVNGINMRFATITQDLKIKVRLAGYFVAKGPRDFPFIDRRRMDGDPKYRVDSNYTLTSLDAFLKSKNRNPKSSVLPEYNHAMFFIEYAKNTKTTIGGSVLGEDVSIDDVNIDEDIDQHKPTKDGVSGDKGGTSFVGKICSASEGTSIVVDHGAYTSAGIGAHELGHNMGVYYHDGEDRNAPKAYSKQCDASNNYIMSPASFLIDEKNLKYSFTFSKCSLEQISKYVERLNKINNNCMKCSARPRNTKMDIKLDNEFRGHLQKLPGQTEGVHTQCKQLYGEESFMCPPTSPDEMCYRMYCFDVVRGACAIISEQMAAPGTPCGKFKVCNMGKCVSDRTRGKDVPDDCPYEDIPSKRAHCEDATPYMCKNQKFRQKCCASCSKDFTEEEACKNSHTRINTYTCSELMIYGNGATACLTHPEVKNLCCKSCKEYAGSAIGPVPVRMGQRGQVLPPYKNAQNRPSAQRPGRRPAQPTQRPGKSSTPCEDSKTILINYTACPVLIKSNPHYCEDCKVRTICCKSCINSGYKPMRQC